LAKFKNGLASVRFAHSERARDDFQQKSRGLRPRLVLVLSFRDLVRFAAGCNMIDARTG